MHKKYQEYIIKWIPVEERLPQVRLYENGNPAVYLITTKQEEVPMIATINHNDLWSEICWTKYESHPLVAEVIAWAELPKLYSTK